MANRKLPKILEHFNIPDSLDDNFKAKCKYCHKEISGSLGTTTNFIKHIKRCHSMKYEEFISQKEPKSDAQQKLNLLPKFCKKYPPHDARQHEITDELVSFIAGDLIPLSIVENPRFRNLIFKLDPQYQIPSRKHLSTKLLTEKSIEIHEQLMKKLEQVKSIALTTDLWSNRQMKSYIGITGHFILNWQMNSIMLACHRFSGRHTACNIFEIFQEIIASFEINNKISSIITDNAYNMVNAFSNFSLPGFVCQQEEFDNSDIEDDGFIEPNFHFEDDVLALLPPIRNSCFAHTLQLVVKDGLSNADMFTKVISKVSTIISYVHKSCIATEILSDENRLQSSVPQSCTRGGPAR